MLTVMKSESLNLLALSGPVQACRGTALLSFYLLDIMLHYLEKEGTTP